MKTFLAVLFILPTVAFAQQRRDVLERKVEVALRNARQAIQMNIQRMNVRELQQAETLLEVVSDIANGNGAQYPTPTPIPEPMPIVCAQDNVERFQSTFILIKNFAYNDADRNSSQSVQYATDWTNKYPCQIANKFITDFKRIKNFAYNDLDKTSASSVQYAEAMVSKVCSEVQFEQIFRQHKNFAYNTLNMTSAAAVNYAKSKVEAEAFYCLNF